MPAAREASSRSLRPGRLGPPPDLRPSQAGQAASRREHDCSGHCGAQCAARGREKGRKRPVLAARIQARRNGHPLEDLNSQMQLPGPQRRARADRDARRRSAPLHVVVGSGPAVKARFQGRWWAWSEATLHRCARACCLQSRRPAQEVTRCVLKLSCSVILLRKRYCSSRLSHRPRVAVRLYAFLLKKLRVRYAFAQFAEALL